MKAKPKSTAILCSFVFLCLFHAVSYEGRSQDILVRMDTATALNGDSITIPVYATNLFNTGSFTFFIDYSTGVLKFGRSLNWNPLLEPGLGLSNASNGEVLVMWAYENGVNLAEGKLFDLRFKYTGGSTLLNFTPQCEITDLMGNPLTVPIQYVSGYATRRLSISATVNPPVLCQGDTTHLGFSFQGGLGSISWSWSSDPPGFTSTDTTPWDIPMVNTNYLISATDGFDTAWDTKPVTVYFYETPSPVQNMTPTDSAANLNLPVLFTWSPATGTSHYDLYVWETGEDEPQDPLVSDITQINYLLTFYLQYGKTYHWRIISKNPCILTAGPVQTFSIRYLPDLAVTQVNVPFQSYSGQTINVNFQVQNLGAGSTQTTQWNDNVYLSTDSTLDPDLDTYIGSYPNISYLNPGEAYTNQIAFTLPQGISGIYYLLVRTDFYAALAESDETNNLGTNADSMYIFLSPVPDLRVAKIVIQANAFSGQNVDITWTVKNYGLASSGGSPWSDRVYFSSQPDPDGGGTNLGTFSHTGNLAPDSLYEITKTVRIPNYIYGTFYMIVVTDVYNQVYEHALENNNGLVSDSIVIFLTPPPDLVTTSVTAPATASVNIPLTIQYTVQNQGANAAIPRWYDKIYLSNSLSLNTNTAFYLGQVTQTKVLLPDSAYTGQCNVTIPAGIAGPYYFFVFADARLDVFEHTEEENNVMRSALPTEIITPDLTPVSIDLPDSANSGNILNISYYTKNLGPGILYGSWTDKIFLSPVPLFDPDTSIEIGSKAISKTFIAAGDSLQQSVYVTLPNGIEGNYFLIAVNDFGNTIFEAGNEANNAGDTAYPIYISLTPWPDLVVTSVSVSPDTLTAGFLFDFSYTIMNSGPGTLTYQLLEQNLFLSKDSVSPLSQYFSTKIKDTVELPPGGSFDRTVQVVLSSGVPAGNYYLWFKADWDNEIYEHSGEDNNLARTGKIYCKPYPPIDLVALTFQAPDSAQSGTFIQTSWSGVNQGIVPTFWNSWNDGFYLSEDTVFTPDDLLLAYRLHTGKLLPGADYSESASLFIPNGLEGDFYIMVYLDYHNRHNDANLASNRMFSRNPDGSPKLMHISFTPPPDLVIESFQCPGTGTAGQPMVISYTVKNNGPGVTPFAYWYDRIYLSNDFGISWQDIVLGTVEHHGLLEKDSSYTDTVTVGIPNNVSGNYIILLKTDISDDIYEHTNEDNNIASQAVAIQVPPPSDLIVSQVIPPTEAETGQPVSITYTLQNQGDNPVVGHMKDLIFISADTAWDITDPLFGSLEGYTSIGPGASINRTCTGILQGITPGDWFVVTRTDVLNNIFESNENNNQGYSIQTIAVSLPELPLDTWLANSLANNSYLYYRIEVPDSLAGETILVRLKADSLYGNNEMYIRFNDLPDRTTYDLAYGNPNAGNQEILIPDALQGTYYLLVYGRTGYGNMQAVKLHAAVLPFQIVSVNAARGGNTGEVTLEMTGSKFTPAMVVFMEMNGTVIPGSGMQFINQTRVFVNFDLNGADTGIYNIAANKFCDGLAVLQDAFTIAAGTLPDLQVNMFYPSAARPFGIIPVIIEYANAGNIDLIAPEVLFSSLTGCPLSLTVSGLSEGQPSLLLPLVEITGPPGILRPGANGNITVYARATSGLAFTLELPNY